MKRSGTRVTVRKEGNHYVVSINGVGYAIESNKRTADAKAAAFRRQLAKIKKGR